MEITTKAVLMKNAGNPETFLIKIRDQKHAQKVKKKLSMVQKQIIDFLKDLKEQGEIKSIWIPKNKKIQKQLDQMVQAKRDIKDSLEKIKEIFD